ncbi:hypothetical protein B9Z55_023278 [Caenorhabditis nigoni]|nr:hypothetical protein B9Z55_023278 [Caenorhabditis nigoni]
MKFMAMLHYILCIRKRRSRLQGYLDMIGFDEDEFNELCAWEEHQELFGIPARRARREEKRNNRMPQQDHDQERETRKDPDPPAPENGVLLQNDNKDLDEDLESPVLKWSKLCLWNVYTLVVLEELKQKAEKEEEEEQLEEDNNNEVYEQDLECEQGLDPLKPDHEDVLSSLHEKYDFETLSWRWAKQKELFEEQNLNFLIEMKAAGLKYKKRTGRYINSILDAYNEGFEYMEGVKSAEIYIHPRQLAPIIEELNALYECHWFIDQLRANMKANQWGRYFVSTNTDNIICY